MAFRNKSRIATKENRIPIGKKKENLEKIGKIKKSGELVDSQVLLPKKASKSNEPLKIININAAPTDTSLTKPVKKPQAKLSTIKEVRGLEEKATKLLDVCAKTKSNGFKTFKTVVTDTSTTEQIKSNSNDSTILVRKIQDPYDIGELNNTIDEMKIKPSAVAPEVVLSPFVCTTRGEKWKPSPRKPPKLSELFDKYEDDDIADMYKKKLDGKTIELQNKAKYWMELSSEINIPQSIKDEIDVVCGQTKLLTTDKFMQMRSLIEEFDNKSGSMPITATDLDGFWDMLLLQVEKLEGQFTQLGLLKENNWVSLQPVAKKVINKVLKVNKRPEVKSKFADFLKNQKKEMKPTSTSNSSGSKNISKYSKFHEFKSSNNTCIISSTPTSSNQKVVSFTPMLLKTMELSYVARRSGMSPLVVVKPHVSPLKPALKNHVQKKATKRKNIHFEPSNDGLITPKNVYNDDKQKNNVQDRITTPHPIKTTNVNRTNIIVNNSISSTINAEHIENNINLKSKAKYNAEYIKNNVNLKTNAKKTTTALKNSAEAQNIDSTIRRSSRLANKPSKNYKC